MRRGFSFTLPPVMRRILVFLFGVIFLAALAVAWLLFGSGTGFRGKKATLYISAKAASREAVLDSLRKNEIVSSPRFFDWMAGRLGYWNRVRPGKYEFANGTSLYQMIRTLRNGAQTPVKLTINKLRTRGDLAKIFGGKFEGDSATMIAFLNNADSMRSFKTEPEQALTLLLPDTYTYYWNNGPREVLRKFADVTAGFWTSERVAKAKALGLSPQEAYTVASIVEEETNAQAEKGNVASVYLNRLAKGMPLQADPTIKFALNDFTLRRIYEKHLFVASPYNTYRNKGLPPGPICTPSRRTIDAVLNAPHTTYLFFVASPAFDGTHVFSSTYEEHLQKAKAYQEELNRQEAIKNGKSS
ncbi:MAG: endolytic transglycosylase MltG [Chitinophagaceae bacterium]|nr:MAG: endolytic transglycosylase MltG [Chitinophagaceae bacterium]